ncbi:hypothetical protein [Ligilactobacillus salivarius]
MKNVWLILKVIRYLLMGIICLTLIFIYKEDITFHPTKYTFEMQHMYFFITTAILPFFRLKHQSWFISDGEPVVSYKQKALDLHHQDLAQNHKDRKWTSNGVYTNPYEYTSVDTMSHDNMSEWLYSIAKSVIMSILFIFFGPIFIVIGIYVKYKS